MPDKFETIHVPLILVPHGAKRKQTFDEARRDLVTAVPVLQAAIGVARASGGIPELAVIVVAPDGRGGMETKLSARWTAEDFFAALAIVLTEGRT